MCSLTKLLAPLLAVCAAAAAFADQANFATATANASAAAKGFAYKATLNPLTLRWSVMVAGTDGLTYRVAVNGSNGKVLGKAVVTAIPTARRAPITIARAGFDAVNAVGRLYGEDTQIMSAQAFRRNGVLTWFVKLASISENGDEDEDLDDFDVEEDDDGDVVTIDDDDDQGEDLDDDGQ